MRELAVMAEVPKGYPQQLLRYNLNTIIDIDWKSPETLEACLQAMGLARDTKTITALLQRVYGLDPTPNPSIIGAREFGSGGSILNRSVLVAYEGNSPNSVSFNIHSSSTDLRRQHAQDLEKSLRQIKDLHIGESRTKWRISVELAGFPMRVAGIATALRDSLSLSILATGGFAALALRYTKAGGVFEVSAVAVVSYLICVLFLARRKYVLEIR